MDGSTARKKLTVPEFIDWADAQSDETRYELLNGEIVAQASPLRRHARVIAGIVSALDESLPSRCEVLTGSGIAVEDDSALEPDVVVFCGNRPDDDTRYDGSPAIVVEVLSPSTASRDMGVKLAAYQRIPSLDHYLIVHPVERFVLIHSAGPERDWSIVRVAKEDFALDPPGVTVPFETIFARLND